MNLLFKKPAKHLKISRSPYEIACLSFVCSQVHHVSVTLNELIIIVVAEVATVQCLCTCCWSKWSLFGINSYWVSSHSIFTKPIEIYKHSEKRSKVSSGEFCCKENVLNYLYTRLYTITTYHTSLNQYVFSHATYVAMSALRGWKRKVHRVNLVVYLSFEDFLEALVVERLCS